MILYSKKRICNKEVITLLGYNFIMCDNLEKKYNKYSKKQIEKEFAIRYFFRFFRFINFKNPKLFTEKIQWLKLNDCNPEKTCLADKIAVREWVKDKIGEKYLKKIYGIYNSFDEIDFKNLPDEYAIKTNHGSKMNMLIYKDIKPDYNKIKTFFSIYLSTNYAYKGGLELHYNGIKPKIFIEELLTNTDELFEYLFFCFNGVPQYVLFTSGKTDGNLCSTMFDVNWNNLRFNYGGNLHSKDIPKPINFDKMLEIAKILSEGFMFVRVDLHNINGKIYFGEMTFTPSGGYMKFNPKKYDRILGDKLKLS